MKTINVLKLSVEELQETFGIEVDEDGTVYDPVEDRSFATIIAWKYFTDQQEQDEMRGGKEYFGGRYGYDDEY